MNYYKLSNHLLLLFLFCSQIFSSFAQAQSSDQFSSLAKEAQNSLKKGITYFHSIAIEGGYVYHYSLDLKEKWGEGKTDDQTIEVQPPGTPAVGMAFLKAYTQTHDPAFLQAAEDAANALIRGQNKLGGWEHKIHFDRPTGKNVSFDDDQTQSTISFLMALDQQIDRPELSQAIEKALDMMLESQMEYGAWPHRYPYQGNYHDYATFNDEGINDCIRVMLEAHRYYGKDKYLESLHKVGRFLMISQLPPPQPGWAQQYNAYLQPAWARSFEPPAICPPVGINNINNLIDLYLHTGHKPYLEPIPDALKYLEESRLPNGKWGRFLELGTNKALYYDRGRIRVDAWEDLSLERRTGYGYQVNLEGRLSALKTRYASVLELEAKAFPAELPDNSSIQDKQKRLDTLAKQVRAIVDAQDPSGRWITHQDKFRKEISVQKWKGEYRIEDRISSAVFNQQVNTLCEFLELYAKMN